MTPGRYVFTVLSLASLFFVVTGIQFWVTKYAPSILPLAALPSSPPLVTRGRYILQIILKGSDMGQNSVTAAFGATSIAAPILGVVCGGMHVDRIGGYKGPAGLAKTLRSCFVFATIAGVFAITTAYLPKQIAEAGSPVGGFWTMIGLIAVVLVFGGAIIPAATGCIISVVHPSIRQLSSAGSMFCFQQLGYAASPFLSGLIAGLVKIDQAATLVELNLTMANSTIQQDALSEAQYVFELDVCLQVVMWWGCFGLGFMLIAWRLAEKGARSGTLASYEVPGQPPQGASSDTKADAKQKQKLPPIPAAMVDVQSASALPGATQAHGTL